MSRNAVFGDGRTRSGAFGDVGKKYAVSGEVKVGQVVVHTFRHSADEGHRQSDVVFTKKRGRWRQRKRRRRVFYGLRNVTGSCAGCVGR